MSHHTTLIGRFFVECDERVPGDEPARCGRKSYGPRDRLNPGRPLSIFDLPVNWVTTPYSADYDHGITRTSLIDGSELKPFPHLVGIKGDLHTCPDCYRRRTR